MNRRDFLQFTGLSGIALGAGMVPFQSIASAQSNRNFVFVFNGGGWDPTRVFANCFDQRAVDMEPNSGISQIGDFKWVDHQKKFMADRTAARRLRYASYDALNCHHLYECGDKCGSFWGKVPVAWCGRPNKSNAKQVYEFSVQVNVVCGPGGVLCLAIIPKSRQ